MSLISQRDREVAMTAINHYVYQDHKSELPEVYALLNWIKLEYYKNEN